MMGRYDIRPGQVIAVGTVWLVLLVALTGAFVALGAAETTVDEETIEVDNSSEVVFVDLEATDVEEEIDVDVELHDYEDELVNSSSLTFDDNETKSVEFDVVDDVEEMDESEEWTVLVDSEDPDHIEVLDVGVNDGSTGFPIGGSIDGETEVPNILIIGIGVVIIGAVLQRRS